MSVAQALYTTTRETHTHTHTHTRSNNVKKRRG